MLYFVETGLLTVYCFSSLFFAELDIRFVTAFLLMICFHCLCYFQDSRHLIRRLSVIYICLSFFLPSLLLFLPSAAYSILKRKCYVLFGVAFVSCGYFYFLQNEPHWLFFFYFLFGISLAFLLEYQNQSYETLHKLYQKTRDDSTELTLLLKEKNQSLLQKQDSEIYTATLRERNRIARDIHDNVGHMLSRSILMVGALKAINSSPQLSEPLDALDRSLNEAMDSIRQSVHNLHDDSVDLHQTLQNLIQDFQFCPVEFHYDIEPGTPIEVKYCFISITKEALSNIIKHSNASKVTISCHEHPALYQLCITDNGTISSKKNGLGLTNMREF